MVGTPHLEETPMFVTIVEGNVEAEREADLRSAWERTSTGALPAGFIESSLLRSDDGSWRIVTVWESRDAVMAMRASTERPAALMMFEEAGSAPSVSMWNVEGRISRS
jgi:heme-degrading monooxygenase HmoA